MAWGPGKYDKQCQELLEQFEDADGVMLLVARRDATKSGFSISGIAEFILQAPELLRETAAKLERDIANASRPLSTVAVPISTADDGPFKGRPDKWKSTLEGSLPVLVLHREAKTHLIGRQFTFKPDEQGALTAFLHVEQPPLGPLTIESGILILTGTDADHLRVDFGIVSRLSKDALFQLITNEDFGQFFEPSHMNDQ